MISSIIDPGKIIPPNEGPIELLLFLYFTFFIGLIIAVLYQKNKDSKRL